MTAAADVGLRRVTVDDADTLLTWANDPAVREASFSARPIDRDQHIAWLTARLADPACAMWMGLARSDATPIGVVRFERDAAGVAVVSIIVAAEARGHGFGAVLLDDGLAAARTALRPSAFRAWVRPTNEVSIRLFEGAGFQQRDADLPDRLVFELAG